MEIGITINYKDIDKYIGRYKDTGVEISHIQINGLPAEVSKISRGFGEKVGELRSMKPGLTVSLHAYKYNFTEKVERVLNVWIELAQDTIQFANEIGAEFINFHAGYGSGSTRIKHEAYREALIPVFQKLVDTARPYGMEIHIENLFPLPTHSLMRMLGDRVSDFDCFFKNIKDPLFKLCYDYGHGNLDEYGIVILRRFHDRLGSMHAHDNDQATDMHLPIGYGGSGTIDWAGEFEYLREIGFEGPFILENSIENQLKSLKYLSENGKIK